MRILNDVVYFFLSHFMSVFFIFLALTHSLLDITIFANTFYFRGNWLMNDPKRNHFDRISMKTTNHDSVSEFLRGNVFYLYFISMYWHLFVEQRPKHPHNYNDGLRGCNIIKDSQWIQSLTRLWMHTECRHINNNHLFLCFDNLVSSLYVTISSGLARCDGYSSKILFPQWKKITSKCVFIKVYSYITLVWSYIISTDTKPNWLKQ